MTEHKDEREKAEAYRLYILDQWKTGGLKISEKHWEPGWGEFNPNKREDINALLKRAGVLKKDPGQYLSKIFQGKRSGFNITLLSDLAAYLGIFSYSVFIKNHPLLNKYVQRLNKAEMNLSGVYKGYYLDRYFDESGGTLRTLLLQAAVPGDVIIDDGEPGHSPHKGRSFLYQNGQILLITGDATFDGSKIPRYHIVLKLPREAGRSDMEGIVGGYSKMNIPFTTMIWLVKLPYTTIESAKNGGEKIENFTLAKQKSKVFEKIIHKNEGILSFFLSNKFYSSARECLLEELKPGKEVSTEEIPEGLFFIYAFSSYKRGIVRYPLLLYKNGVAKIKTHKGTIEGTARMAIENEYLILDFLNYPGKKPFMGVFIAYTQLIETAEFIPAVSARINDKGHPQAKREYMVPFRVGKGNYFDKHVNEFEESEFEYFFYDSLRYNELKKLNSNISSLFGREYNLLVQSTSNLNPDDIFNREKFDKIYFNQAIIEFLKENKDLKEVRRYFRLALQHGLFIENRYEVYLMEFYKTLCLDKDKIKAIKDKFKSLYNELKEEYKSGKNNTL